MISLFYPLNKLIDFSSNKINKQIILFRGPPGSGKTSLAIKLIIPFSIQGKNELVRKNKVIYYSLEEGPEFIKNRYIALGGNIKSVDRIFPDINIEGLRSYDALRMISRQIEHRGNFALIVIDSIQSYIDNKDKNNFRNIIKLLKKIAVNRNSNIIIIAENVDKMYSEVDIGHLVDISIEFFHEEDKKDPTSFRLINTIKVSKARNYNVTPFIANLEISDKNVDILLPISALQQNLNKKKIKSVEPSPSFSIGINVIDNLYKQYNRNPHLPQRILLEGEPHTNKTTFAFNAFLAGTKLPEMSLNGIYWITIEEPVDIIVSKFLYQIRRLVSDTKIDSSKIEELKQHIYYLEPNESLNFIGKELFRKIEEFNSNNHSLKKLIITDLSYLYESHDKNECWKLIRFITSIARIYGFTLLIIYTKPIIFGEYFDVYRNFDIVIKCAYSNLESFSFRTLSLHLAQMNIPINPDTLFYDYIFNKEKMKITFTKKRNQIFNYKKNHFEIGKCKVYLNLFATKNEWKKYNQMDMRKCHIAGVKFFAKLKTIFTPFKNKLTSEVVDIFPIFNNDRLDIHLNFLSLEDTLCKEAVIFTFDEPWLINIKNIVFNIFNKEFNSIAYENLDKSFQYTYPYLANHSCLLINCENKSIKNKEGKFINASSWSNLLLKCFSASKATLYVFDKKDGLIKLFIQLFWDRLFYYTSTTQSWELKRDITDTNKIEEIIEFLKNLIDKMDIKKISSVNELCDNNNNWILSCWLTDVQKYRTLLMKEQPQKWEDNTLISLIPQEINSNGKYKSICLNGDWFLGIFKNSSYISFGLDIMKRIFTLRYLYNIDDMGLPLNKKYFNTDNFGSAFVKLAYNKFYKDKTICRRRSSIKNYIEIQNLIISRISNLILEKRSINKYT